MHRSVQLLGSNEYIRPSKLGLSKIHTNGIFVGFKTAIPVHFLAAASFYIARPVPYTCGFM